MEGRILGDFRAAGNGGPCRLFKRLAGDKSEGLAGTAGWGL